MRILLVSDHEYPALPSMGGGLQPKAFPSGSGYLLHDLLAKGLAELGHEVFYLVPHAPGQVTPPGVTLVAEAVSEVDLRHASSDLNEDPAGAWAARGEPSVTTCHLIREPYRQAQLAQPPAERTPPPSRENWIFVSRTLARLYGRTRFVHNGIDPAEYLFSEAKDDYLLFMASMEWGNEKGLDVALARANEAGARLIVAGTARTQQRIDWVAERCREANAEYVGDVRGRRKAELLARARAFLFPTRLDEAFGLGMVEALMSGTPVICSDRGACPELISTDVGFVCATAADYREALRRIDEISPAACRAKALRDYHYLRMAREYVKEYEREIGLGADRLRVLLAQPKT